MTVRVRLIERPCVEADIDLAQLDLAVRSNLRLVPALAARLYDDATRADLPEFLAWALVHQAVPDDPRTLSRAKAIAQNVDNPALHARIRALTGSSKLPRKADLR